LFIVIIVINGGEGEEIAVIGSSPSSHPNTRKPRVSGTPVIAVIGKPTSFTTEDAEEDRTGQESQDL
jgi:hypothetical protein